MMRQFTVILIIYCGVEEILKKTGNSGETAGFPVRAYRPAEFVNDRDARN
jgi:hypothetical protein